MQINIAQRDGPGRLGTITFDTQKIRVPNMFFMDTKRFPSPAYAELLLSKDTKPSMKKPTLWVVDKLTEPQKPHASNLQITQGLFFPKDLPAAIHLNNMDTQPKNQRCQLIPGNTEAIAKTTLQGRQKLHILGNTAQLFTHPKVFVDTVIQLREKIGSNALIYLPAIGNPSCLALVCYMSIDLLDALGLIQAGRQKVLLFPSGNYHINTLSDLPCTCPSCQRFQKNPQNMNAEDVIQHNYYMMYAELQRVRNAIKNRRLRELVETRATIRPELAAMLSYLDQSHYTFLEKHTPMIGNQLIATTRNALFRPEVKRFKERVIHAYAKPESTRVLLLLPCSARKPYSFSKSHQRFQKIIHKTKNPWSIHEVVLTSPLGVVPRELELIYPASVYDIPVTGHWYEDEKQMLRTILKNYLKKNKYDSIVLHISVQMLKFIEDICKGAVISCRAHPTSDEALQELESTLRKITAQYPKVDSLQRRHDDMLTRLEYQFGKKTASVFLKNTTVKGRYPHLRILENNHQLGMITSERGLLSLTLAGAKKLAGTNRYWVSISDDFTLKGSVFAPGIKDADPTIRYGDEVVVLQKTKVVAVGVALMHGDEMKMMSQGEAVKIRHHH